MNWPASFAKTLSRLLGIASPALIRSKRNADTFGPAPSTDPMQRRDLPPRLAIETVLHKRAERVCNREREAVARYVTTHMSLSRGN